MKKSLVIGGDSLTGNCLISYLREHENQVVAAKLPEDNISGVDDLCVENINLMEPASIIEILKKHSPDYIFNFSAQNSVSYAWTNPGITVDLNVNGALNLFDAVRQLDYNPMVLLVGSGEEYGKVDFSQIPMKETLSLKPGNIYAATKACQTMMAQIYHKAYHMNVIVARTFNDIGPGQSCRFSVSDFCRQAVCIENGLQEPILKAGNPNTQRDFTDIRDLVRAFFLLALKGRPGEVYNVGRGHAYSIREVLEIIQRKINKSTGIYIDPNRIRPIDIPKIEADVTKLKNDTGWEASIPLEKTIDDMMEYWRNHLNDAEENLKS